MESPTLPGAASPAASLRSLYRAALARADRASALAIIAAMAGMTAIVSVQVFLRYALNESIDWGDELARLCFVWAIFLAIPHALKRGGHVGIDLLVRALPGPLRGALARATSGLAALLMLVVFYEAVGLARTTWDQLMPTLNLSAGLFYVAVILGSAHSALHLIDAAWAGPAAPGEGPR